MARSLTRRLTQGAQRIRTDAASALSGLRTIESLFARDAATHLPDDIVHRVVWVIPEDALADGWRTDNDPPDGAPAVEGQDVTRDVDRDLDVERVILEAAGMARMGDGSHHGGAFVWMVFAGDEDYAAPPREGAEVVRLHAVSCTEVTPLTWDSDPTSPRFGLPASYQMTISRGGLAFASREIHASRLVYVPGLRRARRHGEQSSTSGRDWSAVRVYREAMQGMDQGFRSSGRLLERRSIPILDMPEGAAVRSGDNDGLLSALVALKESLTVDKLGVLFNGSRLEWKGPAVSGTGELVTVMAWRMAMVEGIPLTRLLGQPPAGLSSDDQAARRSYHGILSRHRRTVYAEVLLQLYDWILGPDPSRRIEWPPLDEPSAKEQAETSLILAQRDAVYVDRQLVADEEVRARHADGEEVATLALDDRLWAAEQEAPTPDDLAMLEAMTPPPVEPVADVPTE